VLKDLARKVTPPLLWRAAARLKPSDKLPSIIIIIPYFGKFPPWINFLIESIRWNPDIRWVVFTDCDLPENSAPNLEFQRISFEGYKQKVSNKLQLRFNPKNPYKLCDVRPALSYIHSDLCEEYDFVGFGDLDVIYGSIRSVYTNELLNTHEFLSAHRDHISGHFFLMRNTKRLSRLFQKIPKWEDDIVREIYCHLDEAGFAQAVMSVCAKNRSIFKARSGVPAVKALFQELYTTPLPHGTMRWVWKDGILSNEFYRREQNSTFMYLHFLFWHSSKWFRSLERVSDEAVAPWKKNNDMVKMDWRLARREGFMISQNGIEPIMLPIYS
jgi:hypothetical protein